MNLPYVEILGSILELLKEFGRRDQEKSCHVKSGQFVKAMVCVVPEIQVLAA